MDRSPGNWPRDPPDHIDVALAALSPERVVARSRQRGARSPEGDGQVIKDPTRCSGLDGQAEVFLQPLDPLGQRPELMADGRGHLAALSTSGRGLQGWASTANGAFGAANTSFRVAFGRESTPSPGEAHQGIVQFSRTR
jgi:hypothetical protein